MKYMTRKEAAEYLAVSLRVLDGLIARGQIPAHRVGGKLVRIKDIDIEAYMSRQLIVPDAATPKKNARPCRYVPGMKVV